MGTSVDRTVCVGVKTSTEDLNGESGMGCPGFMRSGPSLSTPDCTISLSLQLLRVPHLSVIRRMPCRPLVGVWVGCIAMVV